MESKHVSIQCVGVQLKTQDQFQTTETKETAPTYTDCCSFYNIWDDRTTKNNRAHYGHSCVCRQHPKSQENLHAHLWYNLNRKGKEKVLFFFSQLIIIISPVLYLPYLLCCFPLLSVIKVTNSSGENDHQWLKSCPVYVEQRKSCTAKPPLLLCTACCSTTQKDNSSVH